jgi:iron-sulfur cluster assembly accessory protein
MTSSIVSVTKQAWRKMDQILQSSSCKHGFLYSVSSGGCNGFNFQLHLMKEGDKEPLMKMKPSVIQNGLVHLYVEPMSELYLIGTKIDYVSEDYEKGLFENKFVYIVDKKKASTCGCGTSFMPRDV